jgi:hypothetical protein
MHARLSVHAAAVRAAAKVHYPVFVLAKQNIIWAVVKIS